MSRRITVALSTDSIDKALREINEYRAWLNKKSLELSEALARLGCDEAKVSFARARYDGTNDVSVTYSADGNGYVVKAAGNAVCFIEFGAGVYHNGEDSYPGERPTGVVGIGEYGKGNGKRNNWIYYGKPGTHGQIIGESKDGRKRIRTWGNPASAPMYWATEEIRSGLESEARRIFGG